MSEDILYLLTLLAAPWLLRQGQHIRVDILLRALPARIGWLLEWVGDVLGLACSLYFVWYGWKVLSASYQAGAITIKTLVTAILGQGLSTFAIVTRRRSWTSASSSIRRA